MSERREPWLVPGTTLVAYLLATSRWGSYAGLPSHAVYVSDLLLLGTLAWVVVRHRRHLLVSRRALWSLAPVAALITWALLRFGLGGDGGLGALRDLAPYAYAVIAACSGMVRTGAAARARSLRVVVVALLVHLAWSTVSTADSSLAAGLPVLGNGVHVLDLRPDVDGASLAVLAGYCVHRALTARIDAVRRVLTLLVAVLCAGVVLQLANRAALLALVVAGLGVALTDVRVLTRLPRRHVAGGLLALALLAAAVVPTTGLYHRLSGDPAYAANAASATQQARIDAWRDVIAYVDDSPRSIAVGVGFGPDFVWNSGAALRLQGPGDNGVRAPHSFALNTYARLGVIGVALLGWLVLAALRAAVTATRRTDRDDLTLVALLVAATLLITSQVGVVIEAPFGALPFFWAVGLLLADARRSQGAVDVDGAQAPGSGEGVTHDDIEHVARR